MRRLVMANPAEAREALRQWLRDELASERGFITGSVDHIADKLLAAFPALTPVPDNGAEERLRAIVESWEASAQQIDERTFFGDPAANIATANTLRSCAAKLRAALHDSAPSGTSDDQS
jgi:hypothetical protein